MPPYTSKKVRLLIDDGTTHTIETVELIDLEVSREGGVESKYGKDFVDGQYKPRNRHKIGMKRTRFTLRKWYKADTSNTDLLYTLFDNDTEFILEEYIPNIVTGVKGLQLRDCIIYHHIVITGSSNDIIGEEVTGEGIRSEKKYDYYGFEIIDDDIKEFEDGYERVLI